MKTIVAISALYSILSDRMDWVGSSGFIEQGSGQ